MSLMDNLRYFREKAGYRQAKDFADFINIKYPNYMAYENKGTWPSQENLVKIATALHVSLDELLGYEGKAAAWVDAKLKPALETTMFSFDGFDDGGNLRFSCRSSLERGTKVSEAENVPLDIVMTMEESRALYDRAAREAAPDYQKHLSRILETAFFTKLITKLKSRRH